MLKSKKPPQTGQLESCIINVRVVPRSSKIQIEVLGADQYKIKLTSPPVDGEANKQLVRVLSGRLSIPSNRIEIISGSTSRVKRVRITGFKPTELPSLLCG